MDIRKQIGNAQRIVVKVGTSTLLHPNGKINLYRIEHLARELADLASQGREAIDIDARIVEKAGCSIPEIFAAEGEAAFRALEREVTTEVGKLSGKIILTGGGVVKDRRKIGR